MKCPKCNHENADGAKFCSNCATQLCQVCPSCNATNIPVEAKFCPVCGNKLNLIAKEEELVNECERLSKEEKLLTLALEEYAYEYKRFKNIWKVGIILSIPCFFIFSILIWFAYTNYFRPQYELKLLKKYKEKYKLQ
ncbi:MAG: zinc-ribbon domain-containing protein [Paludibacteraceae bacterium]|nr:zinc-ribbon domain-containing protein [Paludibacteraceae bacterium]